MKSAPQSAGQLNDGFTARKSIAPVANAVPAVFPVLPVLNHGDHFEKAITIMNFGITVKHSLQPVNCPPKMAQLNLVESRPVAFEQKLQ